MHRQTHGVLEPGQRFVEIEVQAGYLERLGLLTPEEREQLTADDFASEVIEPQYSVGYVPSLDGVRVPALRRSSELGGQ